MVAEVPACAHTVLVAPSVSRPTTATSSHARTRRETDRNSEPIPTSTRDPRGVSARCSRKCSRKFPKACRRSPRSRGQAQCMREFVTAQGAVHTLGGSVGLCQTFPHRCLAAPHL